MSERLPALELNMNGEKMIATPENTTLFMFAGELAVYDHVFVELTREDDVPSGAYLFKNQEMWHDLVDWMVTNEYPQHVCLREVGQCDVNAFEHTMYPDIRGMKSFPEGWTDGE